MGNIQPQKFIEVEPAELHSRVALYKAQGWQYVNTNATIPSGETHVELLCSFAKGNEVENLRVILNEGDHISSISDLYFSAFVFENEAHDLFGVNFDGLAIDFKGTFYKLTLDQPMRTLERPAAATGKKA